MLTISTKSGYTRSSILLALLNVVGALLLAGPITSPGIVTAKKSSRISPGIATKGHLTRGSCLGVDPALGLCSSI